MFAPDGRPLGWVPLSVSAPAGLVTSPKICRVGLGTMTPPLKGALIALAPISSVVLTPGRARASDSVTVEPPVRQPAPPNVGKPCVPVSACPRFVKRDVAKG